MARNAMVAIAAMTPASRMTMNHAARFAVCGEGWVIPIVLIKAFEMSRRRFTFRVCEPHHHSKGIMA
jgi:hypothetical protein